MDLRRPARRRDLILDAHDDVTGCARCRDEVELDAWRRRDPIARLEEYLRATGEFSDEHVAETQAAADAVAKEMRAACLGMVTRPPLSVFEGVYAEPHTGLERQRDEYAAYLATFDVEA